MVQPVFATKTQKGIISLLFTLIVGSVALSIAVSMLIFGTDISLSAEVARDSNEAKSLANACAEYALELIRDNPSVTANNVNLSLTTGTCNYSIINGGGDIRTINAQATVRNTTRKIQAVTSQIRPKILLSSWKEVADF